MQSAINIIFKIVIIVVVFLCVSNSIFGVTQTNLTKDTTPPSVALNPATGNPQTGDFGSIGLYNGRLNYTIPLLKTGGRGASDYTISLDINRLWQFDHYYDYYESGGNGIYTQYTLPNSTNWWGDSLKYMPGRLVDSAKFGPQPVCNQPRPAGYYSYQGLLRFISQNGAEISLVSQAQPTRVPLQCTSYNPNPNNPGTFVPVSLGNVFTTVDGSAIKFVTDQEAWAGGGIPTSGYLYFPDGKKYRIDDSFVSWIEDRNGNRTSFVYEVNPYTQRRTKILQIIDSNGRPTDISYGFQDSEYGLHDKISYTGFNGAPQTIRVTYGQLGDALRAGETLKNQTQLFGELQCQNGQTNCPPTDLLNPTVVTSVVFPGNRRFRYKYNSYAELARVETPQGAAFEYDWGGSLEGGDEKGVINYDLTYPDLFRQVLEKRVYHNGGSGNSFEFRTVIHKSSPYDPSAVYPNHVSTRTVSFSGRNNVPLGLQKQVFFGHPLGPGPKPNQEQPDDSIFPDLLSGKDKESLDYGSDGVTLLRRDLKQWSFETESGVVDPRVAKQITIAPEGNQAAIILQEIEYDNNGIYDSNYFSHLNVEISKAYNYKVLDLNTAKTANLTTLVNLFSQSDLASVSETDYLYAPGYKDRHILGLSTETRVMNPANPTEILAKSQIVYDEQNLYYSMVDYGTTIGYIAPTGTYAHLRGNSTTHRTWFAEENRWIETHTQFDNFGNVRKVWDSSGDQTRVTETVYEHTTEKPYYFAFPTKVIAPAPDPSNTTGTNQTSTVETTYDFDTGLLVKIKDDFGQEIETEYDELLRPKRVSPVAPLVAPVTETIYGVPDASGQLIASQRFVKVRKQIDATNWDEATTWFDGLGRTIKTQAKDSQGDVFVETKYDKMGRVEMVTNPYRAGNTIYWNLTEYDELGRVKQAREPVINQNPAAPTGNVLGTTAYSISTVSGFVGTVVTSTDASGRKGRSITNALGQLLRVDEPTSVGGTADADLGAIGSPIQPTYYTYDVYGKMVKVQQGKTGEATIQYRYFKYDSLGRLIRVRQPEQEVNTALNLTDSYNTTGQWTAGFSYDIFGNVLTTTDAKGVVMTNTYDKASRIKTRTYSDGTPTVSYFYDGKGLASQQSPNYGKGKLTKVASSVSETRYKLFDNFGRLTESEQRTPAGAETIVNATPRVSKYQYNLSGMLTEQEYPSTRIVKNNFETDGDLSLVFGKANQDALWKTYATEFAYTPDGRIERLRLGNSLWESAKFDPARGQVTELALGTTAGDGSLWKLEYKYGELAANGVDVEAAKNTGNIAKQTLSFNGLAQPLVQTYRYDSLYRLKEARETSGITTTAPQTWKQAFDYDRFGNRTTYQKFVGTNQITLDSTTFPSVNAANNRLNANQNYSYDKNGNVIVDAQGRQFFFNGDNKQIEVKNASNVLLGKYYYDGTGKRVKKKTYDPYGVEQEETVFVYDGMGKLVAEYSTKPPPTNPTTSFTATDQLGSPRVITNSLGEVTSRRDFQPFGEELAPDATYRKTADKYGAADSVRQRFTGYQKDDETGLDFAEARMYENRHGRFTAVDPLLASGKSGNPQTFNRYVYVMNNPLVLTDPDGLQAGFWTYRDHTSGGREYKHFKSQAELDQYNSIGFTEFGQATGFTPYNPWSSNWALWYDRTGARLNDNGTMTHFSAESFSQEEWDQTVRNWYEGKPFEELTEGRLRGAVYDSTRETNGLVNLLQVPSTTYNYYFGGTINQENEREGIHRMLNDPVGQSATLSVGVGLRRFGSSASSEQRMAVIGRLEDTRMLQGLRNAEILTLPRNVWSIERNDAWVNSVIQRRMPVYLASPLTPSNLVNPPGSRFSQTVFGREVQMFREAGYTQYGNRFFGPPSQ